MKKPSTVPSHPPRAHRPLKKSARVAVLALSISAIGVFAYTQGTAALQLPEARGQFVNAAGASLGTASVKATGSGVQVRLELRGLTPGSHGAHVHATGNCAKAADPATGEVIPFGASGGHFDPFVTRNHGAPTDDPRARHAGVLPNLEVSADGVGRLNFETAKLTVSGAMTTVADRAIVIHANADDFETDPAGNSGARIACAELRIIGSSAAARYKIPSSDAFPEGIAVDAKRGVLLTGASNGGDIWQVSLTSGKAQPFSLGGSPGRNVALGLHLDANRRLWVAAGATGRVAVVSADTGATLRILEAPPVPLGRQPFINDLAFVGNDVYVTDSFRPVIYRSRSSASQIAPLEPWLDLSQTTVRFEDGVNLNGIVASGDGKALLSIQTNTGKLYRIDIAARTVRQVTLDSSLTGGDGLVLSGQTLYVIRNAQSRVDRVELNADFSVGRVVATRADPAFRFPTTGALYRGRLLIVNAQLDKQREPPPVLPFTIVAVPVPSVR